MYSFCIANKQFLKVFYSIICRFPFLPRLPSITVSELETGSDEQTPTASFLLLTSPILPCPPPSPLPPLFPDCEMFATLLSIALFALPALQGVHAEFTVATPKSLTAVSNILTA